MGPHPAVAAIRLAVRRVLHDILTELKTTAGVPPRRPPTACRTARPDSRRRRSCSWPAPAAPTPWHSPPPSPSRPPARHPRRRRSPSTTACRTARTCAPKRSSCVCANSAWTPSRPPPGTVGRGGGPEAAARDARYAALDAAAARHGAAAVLLGHTSRRPSGRDRPAGLLARAPGIRSPSGMAGVWGPAGRYRRPLPPGRPADRPQGLHGSSPARPGDDPHNAGPGVVNRPAPAAVP